VQLQWQLQCSKGRLKLLWLLENALLRVRCVSDDVFLLLFGWFGALMTAGPVVAAYYPIVNEQLLHKFDPEWHSEEYDRCAVCRSSV
jgi:hypothetical protein